MSDETAQTFTLLELVEPLANAKTEIAKYEVSAKKALAFGELIIRDENFDNLECYHRVVDVVLHGKMKPPTPDELRSRRFRNYERIKTHLPFWSACLLLYTYEELRRPEKRPDQRATLRTMAESYHNQMWAAYQLKTYENDARRGRQKIGNLIKAQEERFGTKEEKASRYQKMQDSINAEIDNNNHLSFITACKIVAKKNTEKTGWSVASLKRYTSDPRK